MESIISPELPDESEQPTTIMIQHDTINMSITTDGCQFSIASDPAIDDDTLSDLLEWWMNELGVIYATVRQSNPKITAKTLHS